MPAVDEICKTWIMLKASAMAESTLLLEARSIFSEALG
jgi:hypothetical protein